MTQLATTSTITPLAGGAHEPVGKPLASAAGFASVLAPLTGGQTVEPKNDDNSASSGKAQSVQRPTRPAATPSHKRASLEGEGAGEPEPTNQRLSSQPAATALLPATMVLAQPTHDAAASAHSSATAELGDDLSIARTSNLSPDAVQDRHDVAPDQGGIGIDNSDWAGLSTTSPTPLSATPSDLDAATDETAGGASTLSHRVGRLHKGPADEILKSETAKWTLGLAGAATADLNDQGNSQTPFRGVDPSGSMFGSSSLSSEPVTKDVAAPSSSGEAPSLMSQQPASQLGQALAASHTMSDGSSQLRIVLNPAELGSVQVHIIRTHDGVSTVSVAVERSETLSSLQADLGHLHQALDRAGIPEQRNLVLHLAAADTASGGLPTNAQSGFGGQGTAQDGSQQSRHQGRPSSFLNDRTPTTPNLGSPEGRSQWAAAKWHRAGINITA